MANCTPNAAGPNLCVLRKCTTHGCPDLHKDVPFLWQIFMDGEWKDLEHNQEIERAFSKPSIHSYRLAEHKRDLLIGYLDFNTMMCYGPQTRHVRRLSAPAVDRWVWYYRDKHDEWIQFGEKNSWGKRSTLNSAAIEERYKGNPEDVMTVYNYQLDFKEMCQSMFAYVRPIRRRPEFQTRANNALLTVHRLFMKNYHEQFQISYENDYTTSELQAGHAHHSNIVEMFHREMDKEQFKITKIVRVDNSLLWHIYQRKKEQMLRDNGKEHVNEQRLFHVTRTSAQNSICGKNFDFRYARPRLRNGRGSYFCSNPKYAHSHFERYRKTDGDEVCMFLARVLLGVSCSRQLMNDDDLLPPLREGSEKKLYDSVVDDLEMPLNHAIFYPSQIYPEYIINYTWQ